MSKSTKPNPPTSEKCPDETIKKFINFCPNKEIIELAYHACHNPNNESEMVDKILELQKTLPVMDIEMDKTGQIVRELNYFRGRHKRPS